MDLVPWAIVNGVSMPLDQAQIPVTDPAVTVGWSVFETLRTNATGQPRRLDQHLARLRSSCHLAEIPTTDHGLLAQEVMQLAARMGAARIRITLSGSGFRMVVAVPLDTARFGQPVCVARGIWRDEPYLGGAVKHSSRAPWVSAVRKRGVDDLLLVDGQGRFTEGTTCAIFAVNDGALWTAAHDGRILESTTAIEILERAAGLGIEVRREGAPASGPWQGLYVASTTRDLAPVVEIDGQNIPSWDAIGAALRYRA